MLILVTTPSLASSTLWYYTFENTNLKHEWCSQPLKISLSQWVILNFLYVFIAFSNNQNGQTCHITKLTGHLFHVVGCMIIKNWLNIFLNNIDHLLIKIGHSHLFSWLILIAFVMINQVRHCCMLTIQTNKHNIHIIEPTRS